MLSVDAYHGASKEELLLLYKGLAIGSDPHSLLKFAIGMFARGLRRLAMRALTMIVELGVGTGDARALRAAAFIFLEQGLHARAADILRRVLEMRPEEPQSKLDLALALPSDTKLAVDLLSAVAMGEWDRRFSQVEVVALMELWHVLQKIEISDARIAPQFAQLLEWAPSLSLFRPVCVDLRVVLRWGTDVVDLDLEVLEPNGERCTTFNNTTTCGGIRSRDLACGLGPEEYCIKNARHGCYTVFVKLYSFNGKPPCDVAASISVFLLFGDPQNEVHFEKTFIISEAGKAMPVATITFS